MKLFTFIILLPIVLLLSACNNTIEVPIEHVKYKIVLPPDALYNCPYVTIPKKNLTNKDVSDILLQYENTNEKCRNSLKSIKRFLERQVALTK